MLRIVRPRDDEGAIAVLYAIVFAGVLMPLIVVCTTTLVRSTTAGELQRAADAGSLAAASAIPFGNVAFARAFLSATTAGATDQTLRDLGLDYTAADPLQVACAGVAQPNAAATSNVGHVYASDLRCHASYVSDVDTLVALRDCASALTTPVAGLGLPALPDLSPLLPALLYPGVKVTMSWTVKGPIDSLLGGHGTTQQVTSIAHRRFKNMVVVPEVGLPGGDTINLNPVAGSARTAVLSALDGTERLLASNPATADCATALDAAHDDVADAVDPPGGGPTAQQILADATAQSTPVVAVTTAVSSLGIPYLDFVPVCVASAGNGFVGHLGNFGACSVDGPGAFRADLRRS